MSATTKLCECCKANPCNCRIIAIPIHPEESNVPNSVMYFPISGGRFVKIEGPWAAKSLGMLVQVLEACKPALVTPDSDYSV